jgi:hypothetical protein
MTEITEIVWQVTSCGEISKFGSHPLIHGKTTISPVDHGTVEQGHGSFKRRYSWSGKNPDRVPFCGSMANVSRPSTYPFVGTDGFSLLAGSGKSVLWYVNPSIFVTRTYEGVGQFDNH